MVTRNNVEPLRIADAATDMYHVFVRDYVTSARIGIYDAEFDRTQTVRFNVDLTVCDAQGEPHARFRDRFEDVVCYHTIVRGIETILAGGHIGLVEVLAERVAEMALQDTRVIAARVRVEKLEAIEGAGSVGIELERRRRQPR